VPFRIDRIRSVTPLEESYEVPETFDAARWRAPEMFRPTGEESTVRIRFGPAVARFLREQSDPRELEECPDGGVVRRLRSASVEWVVQQVLRHAPHAEVLEPPEVRAAVAETCATVLRSRAKDPGPAAPRQASKRTKTPRGGAPGRKRGR
jgi:proteasome accessory factor B